MFDSMQPPTSRSNHLGNSSDIPPTSNITATTRHFIARTSALVDEKDMYDQNNQLNAISEEFLLKFSILISDIKNLDNVRYITLGIDESDLFAYMNNIHYMSNVPYTNDRRTNNRPTLLEVNSLISLIRSFYEEYPKKNIPENNITLHVIAKSILGMVHGLFSSYKQKFGLNIDNPQGIKQLISLGERI